MIPQLLMAGGALAGGIGSLFQDDPKPSVPRSIRAPVETSSALLDALATRGANPFPYDQRAPLSALTLLGIGRGVDRSMAGAPMPTLAGGMASLPPGMARPAGGGGMGGGMPGGGGPSRADVEKMLANRGTMMDPVSGEMTRAYNPVEYLGGILDLISPQAAALMAQGRPQTPARSPAFEQVEGQRDIQGQLGTLNERQAGSKTLWGRALKSGDPALAAQVFGQGNVEAARKMMKNMNKGKKKKEKMANAQSIADAFGISLADLGVSA